MPKIIRQCGRIIELLEGDNGRLSMTRLLMLMSFFPCAYIALHIKTVESIYALGGIFVLGYVSGKGADIFMQPNKNGGKYGSYPNSRGFKK